ncbi:MAG: MFS transporter [Immundisolibacter sp.]|uniref:MFS transporter n=1 Tax=Immundisolibacter sp. TaxID=1934948 RepID=UPI0019A57E5D|nr:MFS transporter [Immundisolibacter sp.]MBC7161979.1 MFS transporter [Immundisolibacter sp.]
MARLRLPRTVWVLGFASLLNDTASEMIAPLLPVFLTAVLGAAPAAIGLIEGLAVATASVLQLVSGRLADRGVSTRWLVLGGYGASNLVRPLIALAWAWPVVLLLRFADRIGKGLRTSPRDALLAGAVEERHRGVVFGFHRAMDHGGAMLGPLLAFGLLQAGLSTPQVFAASVVPGALVLLCLGLGLREPAAIPPAPLAPLRWGLLDRRIRGLIGAAGLLAVASVPDAFLVLWAYQGGIEVVWLPLLWAAAHAVRSAISIPAGYLSDRLGRIPVVTGGWLIRAGLLAVMGAVSRDGTLLWGLFLAYAGATACTEGAERALIGDRAPPEQKGTAFGIYYLVSGLLALPGAVLFGGLWQSLGQGSAFAVAAAITLIGAGAFVHQARQG